MVLITAPLTTGPGVRDVFIAEDNRYAVLVTSAGVEFVDLIRGEVVSSGIVPGGFEPLCATADWATSSGLLYVGTSGGGVYSTRYHPARAPGLDFSNDFQLLFSTATSPVISSDVVLDIESLPGSVFIGTSAGVDYISNHTDRSTRSVSGGSYKVHFIEDGSSAYWLTASSVEVNYDLISTLGGGIINLDFDYTVDSVPSLPGPDPRDIAISESPTRILAFPTSSGVLVSEEIPFSESSAQNKVLTSPTGDGFVSADFHPDTDFVSGYLSALTQTELFLYKLSDNSVDKRHPQDLSQTISELSNDQAVASGINTIVRTTTVPI